MAGRRSREQIEADELSREEEINARVDQRVKALFADLKAEIMGATPGAGVASPVASVAEGGSNHGMSAVLSDLVVAMKKVMDPQSQRRIFSPEEISAMERARNEMIRLLIEVDERREKPIYALRQKTFLGEQLIEPQYQDPTTKAMVRQKIIWNRVPNEAMIPVNDWAKKIHAAFMASIGGASMNKNITSSFVLHGNFIRQSAPEDVAPVGNAQPVNVSVGGDDLEPVDYSKPMNVLGTIAAPVVPNQGARFVRTAAPARNG